MSEPATLVLAATPIGRPDDASPRLVAALGQVPVVAAEDTRRLRRLAERLGVTVTGRVVSYFEGNETRRTAELVDALRAGESVLLVTDAGMPSVSDPGYRLVAAALEAGIRVTALPGPSAVLTALAVSGLPVDRFCFEGFLPRKAGERAHRLEELADERRTMVFFEAPRRTAATLRAMAVAFSGERAGAVCRELTKTHEEVRRGPLSMLGDWAEPGIRGEVTIVVGGASAEAAELDDGQLRARVAERQAAGLSRRDAVAAVAHASGTRRRHVYDAVHRPPAGNTDDSAG
ncbi:MAG: 16S rRNA (cytidine(1402)-2'-O)-methyltransferase [Nocardioidaceae bacterium]